MPSKAELTLKKTNFLNHMFCERNRYQVKASFRFESQNTERVIICQGRQLLSTELIYSIYSITYHGYHWSAVVDQ